MKILKLEISRKKWGTGQIKGGSLLGSNRLMCCLGFACIADGAKRKDIYLVNMPSDIPVYARDNIAAVNGIIKRLFTTNKNDNRTSRALAAANDSDKLTSKARESRIKKLFAKRDIKVTFVP